jgi:hypothetical protein
MSRVTDRRQFILDLSERGRALRLRRGSQEPNVAAASSMSEPRSVVILGVDSLVLRLDSIETGRTQHNNTRSAQVSGRTSANDPRF